MANEKILIITPGKAYDRAVIAGFAKNGWTIEHERPSEEIIKTPFPDHKGWVQQKIDDLVASRKK